MFLVFRFSFVSLLLFRISLNVQRAISKSKSFIKSGRAFAFPLLPCVKLKGRKEKREKGTLRELLREQGAKKEFVPPRRLFFPPMFATRMVYLFVFLCRFVT